MKRKLLIGFFGIWMVSKFFYQDSFFHELRVFNLESNGNKEKVTDLPGPKNVAPVKIMAPAGSLPAPKGSICRLQYKSGDSGVTIKEKTNLELYRSIFWTLLKG